MRGPALNAAVGAPLVEPITVRPGTERYWRALKEVRDPELPISVVDMGLIYDIRAVARESDPGVRLEVRMTFTATACPCMELMLMDVEERLLEEGVGTVSIDVVWDPPWTRAMITDEGRATLKKYGVAA
ncbi:MAG: metal-sulfur cluster assembly factor [Longimicrobiales bacterium]|nr:metal-sulfur cluster assembly factor [Longimicrobiales bacterium]